MLHPSRSIPFDALLAGLTADHEAGLVSVVRDGALALYRYTDRCTYDRCWSEFSLMARGLVLDLESRSIVATPFPKFFNYGEGMAPSEPMAPLPDEPFTVTDKVDGSLIIVFFHGGEWRAITRGSFTSHQAKWAQEWLSVGPGQDYLDVFTPGHTYLFEAIYPENRIVVPYDFAGLVLLSAYDERGAEYDRASLEELAQDAGERVVGIVTAGSSIDDLLEIAKSLSADQEGFVVRFASGRRVKIKGEEYCRIHRLVSRVTPLAVFDLLIAGDDPVKVARELPEEFRRDFETIHEILSSQLAALVANVTTAKASTDHLADKELGLWVQSQSEYPADVARWIFPARKRGFLERVHVPGDEARKRACETFRPTGNKLDGYQPSGAMHRFAEAG